MRKRQITYYSISELLVFKMEKRETLHVVIVDTNLSLTVILFYLVLLFMSSHVQFPIDCSLPGSSVHRISQTGMLELVAISFFRGSSRPRDRTYVSCLAGRFVTTESPGFCI